MFTTIRTAIGRALARAGEQTRAQDGLCPSCGSPEVRRSAAMPEVAAGTVAADGAGSCVECGALWAEHYYLDSVEVRHGGKRK